MSAHLDVTDPNLLACTCSRCGQTGKVIITTDQPKGDGIYARWYPLLKAAAALEQHDERCPQRTRG